MQTTRAVVTAIAAASRSSPAATSNATSAVSAFCAVASFSTRIETVSGRWRHNNLLRPLLLSAVSAESEHGGRETSSPGWVGFATAGGGGRNYVTTSPAAAAKGGGGGGGGGSGGGGNFKSPGKVKEGSAYQTETRKVILSLRKVRKVTSTNKELLRNINLGMYLGAKIGILGKGGDALPPLDVIVDS